MLTTKRMNDCGNEGVSNKKLKFSVDIKKDDFNY